jgi:hypothetical protein
MLRTWRGGRAWKDILAPRDALRTGAWPIVGQVNTTGSPLAFRLIWVRGWIAKFGPRIGQYHLVTG